MWKKKRPGIEDEKKYDEGGKNSKKVEPKRSSGGRNMSDDGKVDRVKK
jgi:hypothetical protein